MTYFYRPVLIICGILILISPFVNKAVVALRTTLNNDMSGNVKTTHFSLFDLFFLLNAYPIAVLALWAAYCLKPYKFISNTAMKNFLTAYGVLIFCGAFIQFIYYVSLSFERGGNLISISSDITTLIFNITFGFLILFAGSNTVRNPKSKLDETFK